MKKILIIYASIGLGHKVVAENIGQSLQKHPDLDVRFLDITEFYRGPLTQSSERIYKKIIDSFPALWGFLYTNSIVEKLSLPLRLPFAALKTEKLKKYL